MLKPYVGRRIGSTVGTFALVGTMLLGFHPVYAQSTTNTPTAPAVAWTQQFPTTSPQNRADASMAYDPAIGKFVLFGGYDAVGQFNIPTSFLDGTWVFNGTTWTKLSPATSPSARAGATMAYDPAIGGLVLFGGEGSSGFLNDTWVFNGTTWTQLSLTTNPLPRWGATMAYDAAIGKVVLFGGNRVKYLLDDTWVFNGTTWTQLSPPTSPPARHYATMAYDASIGKVVLFGGANGSQYFGDTWTFNGSTWTQLSLNPSPTARYIGQMAYDSATGNIVHFGGANQFGLLNDTWIFDGTSWTKAAPTLSPPPTVEASMAGDPATGQIVLFGGIGNGGFMGDTWTWNGITRPGAPIGVTATGGNAQVALSWTAPSSNGGSAVTGYDVYAGTASGKESQTPVNAAPLPASATSYTATGLTNGTAYFFTVKALNAAGASTASTEATATPVTTPGSPTSLNATGGNAQVALSWTAPSSNGGSPVTGYDVYEGTASGKESQKPLNAVPLPASATSYTATGLTNGTAYFFTVKALNAVGASAASTQASATPAAPPPALTPESVTVDGVNSQVIGNLGYNLVIAIQNGTLTGYVEERTAIEAGATFSGEGTDSSYLSAILDGSGVGQQQHVSAVQQGQFAALYQKLGIIPTWTDNTVSLPQGVTTLLQSGASTLAIENYLVQLGGFSWTAAQAQAAAGFPLQFQA